MPTYNYAAVTDAVIAFKKPITLQQGRALRDLALAMFEGAVGAPRLQLAALPRLTPGSDIRSRVDAVVTATFNYTPVISFGFMQFGTVRLAFEHARTGSGGTVNTARVVRRRAGVETVLQTYTSATATFAAVTLDVDVIPGDYVGLELYFTPVVSQSRNARFQTDGVDLIPAGAANVEGNSAPPV